MVVVAKARIAKQGSFIFVGVLSIDAVAGMGIKKDWSQLQKDQERERERERANGTSSVSFVGALCWS